MGCMFGSSAGSPEEQQSGSKDVAIATSLHIAVNEVCTADAKFQCTLVNTTGSKITSSQNISCKALDHAGNRVSDVSTVQPNGEFYALIRRFSRGVIDESEIQKYKVTKTNGPQQVQIEFIETVFKGLDKGENINMEGIEVLQTQQGVLGFLLCNDFFATPPNSGIFFVNMKGERRLLHSFEDKGVLELDELVEFKGFGRDGYLVVPQFLGLVINRVGGPGDRDSTQFDQWSLHNDGEAFMYFLRKTDVLRLVNGDDTREEKSQSAPAPLSFEKVKVCLNENVNSEKSFFAQYQDCDNGGVEAMSIGDNNNVLLIFEYNKGQDTFDFIVSGMVMSDNGALTVILDPADYVKVENNGGGHNKGQESLLFVQS